MYVYVYYVHSISCMCMSDWLTADSDICVYVYDIMDDTSAMWDNWQLAHKTAFRLFYTPYHSSFLTCNSRLRSLILTLKQAPRMHQNAPLPDKKIKKKFPRSNPLGVFGALDYRAFGAQRSVPFHLRLEHWRREQIFSCAAVSLLRNNLGEVKARL